MGDMLMTDYLNHVKFLHDSLAVVNHVISDSNLVLYTLNGLSSEYEVFITIVTTFKQLPSFSKSFDMLVSQENRLRILTPSSYSDSSAIAFVAQRGRDRGNFNYAGRVNFNYARGRANGRNGGRSRNNNNYGNGGHGNNINFKSDQGITCQYCGRKSHTARQCYDIPKAFMAMALNTGRTMHKGLLKGGLYSWSSALGNTAAAGARNKVQHEVKFNY
ncbi:hypothetical protein EJ110_NYTH50144 [Nymphaea thermarum]|nr:hypothetical protein EJ110_NYTH50144 [Nymphaea thermarum]